MGRVREEKEGETQSTSGRTALSPGQSARRALLWPGLVDLPADITATVMWWEE